MQLEYVNAKNESLTCTYNGIYLHSSYNPQSESSRFAETLNIDFIPSNIIVIEPALSYCIKDLKQKFPETKIYSIRFIKDIKPASGELSPEKDFFFENEIKLKTELYNYFGEENLLNTFFVSWPASIKVFPQENEKVWSVIKELLKDCQSILATRQFFAECWIKNQIKFFLKLKKTRTVNKIDVPVLICASGPGLKRCMPAIKRIQDNFFIIACSSAIKTLLYNKIKPDLCISTDGGFWAKKHLYCLLQENIPLAVTPEAAVPEKLFDKEMVVLLYDDAFEKAVLDKNNSGPDKIKYLNAKQNGTISGTAAELALLLTDKNIYAAGLDLESGKGFSHTQPNELELNSSIKDFKLKNTDTRTFAQSLESRSLEMYRNWFSENSSKFNERFFRVYSEKPYRHKLGSIKDIDIKELEAQKNIKKNYFSDAVQTTLKKDEITDFYNKLLLDDGFIKNYFPADSIAIYRTKDERKKQELKAQLEKKLNKIKAFIKRQEEKK